MSDLRAFSLLLGLDTVSNTLKSFVHISNIYVRSCLEKDIKPIVTIITYQRLHIIFGRWMPTPNTSERVLTIRFATDFRGWKTKCSRCQWDQLHFIFQGLFKVCHCTSWFRLHTVIFMRICGIFIIKWFVY